MKTLFRTTILTALLSTALIPAFAEKSVPNYSITQSIRDSSLLKNESAFAITFYTPGSSPVRDQIKMSCRDARLPASDTTATLLIKPDDNGRYVLNVQPGKYIMQFYYYDSFLEIKTRAISIEPGFRTDMKVNFHLSKEPVAEEKPVIYVYPKASMPVNIRLDVKGKLGLTYPAYNRGWDFVADPNGSLHFGEKEYNYLFWDGQAQFEQQDVKRNTGFVVSRDSLVPFFERTLAAMGLRPNEIEDYITYWVPRMQANEMNRVHFLFNDEFGKYAPLTITPQPDHLIRVFMLWSEAGETRSLSPQQFPAFSREGFTVVEWGGAELKK